MPVARLVRLTRTTGEEMFVRPETVMAFGAGSGGFPASAYIILWGTEYQWMVRETCQEIATLLNDGATR